jgi:hypothetical protein
MSFPRKRESMNTQAKYDIYPYYLCALSLSFEVIRFMSIDDISVLMDPRLRGDDWI